MLNQKKVEIFLVKFRKSLTKQFLEVAFKRFVYQIFSKHFGYERLKRIFLTNKRNIVIKVVLIR